MHLKINIEPLSESFVKVEQPKQSIFNTSALRIDKMAFEEGASMRGDSLNQSRKSSSSSLSQVELPRIESFKIEYIDDQKIWENKIVEF